MKNDLYITADRFSYWESPVYYQMNNKNDEFTQLLTDAQPLLYGYILKRIADSHAAKDILQETNIIIWRKADSFTPGTKFAAWASSIAHFQTLSYLQKRKRDPLIFNDSPKDTLIDSIDSPSDRKIALDSCLKSLSEENQNLIQTRYSKSKSVNQIAQEQDKSPNAISKILHRCRMNLLKCVSSKLQEGK